MSRPQQFPAGWDEARVRDVIAHYDAQTQDQQADEIEAALAAEGTTMMAVPAELADQVRALVAAHRAAHPAAAPDGSPRPPVS
jgi:cytochrome c553